MSSHAAPGPETAESASGIVYRQATREELDIAVGWAEGEGWNPGRNDAAAFWETDPDGFVVAEVDGQVVATGSIVSYGAAMGFMGFFIVRPDLRHQGIGRSFWQWRRNTLVDRLDAGAPIGMDGVLAMEPFYSVGGFEMSHRNIRMTGAVDGAPDDSLADTRDVPFDELVDFDARHFGIPRPEFLRSWLFQPGGVAVVARDESPSSSVTALGVLRPCVSGFKVGPLFADDGETAERVFGHLGWAAGGAPLSLDVPEINEQAMALAYRHRLTADFACARMYLGDAPDLPWSSIFGVTSFELG